MSRQTDEKDDEVLRQQLISHGEDVGPLNSSTRPYWEKRLLKLNLIKTNSVRSKSQRAKSRRCKSPTKRTLIARKGDTLAKIDREGKIQVLYFIFKKIYCQINLTLWLSY